MFHVGIWLSYISAVREGFRLFGSSLTSTPSFLPSCPPTNHTPCSSFLRNAVKSSALLRVEEEGVGVWGTISADAGQTSVGRTFSALNYAPCTRRALHCWKSMHSALNAMYLPPVTLHWCKASKLRTYVQRKQGLGGLRHFFLFHPPDCKKQLFLWKYSSIKYFWGGRGNKWKHLLKLSLLCYSLVLTILIIRKKG